MLIMKLQEEKEYSDNHDGWNKAKNKINESFQWA